MSRESPDVSDLGELLMEAEAVDACWSPERQLLAITYRCLRRGVDGSSLADRSVDLPLSGVCAIAVTYDPTDHASRPSHLRVPDACRIAGVEPWPVVGEVETVVDGPNAVADVDEAAQVDWLVGDFERFIAARHRMSLRARSGHRDVERWISIAFDEVTPRAGGEPLDWGVWADQYDAWWRGWGTHWNAKGSEADGAPPVMEDSILPLAEDEPSPGYALPDPIVELDPSDCPSELQRVVGDWFVAQHVDPQGFGMVYARAIDDWWIEGRRAGLRVLGILHLPGEDDEPAVNDVTEWSFSLRHRDGSWAVRTWSETNASPPRGLWIRRWRSGPLRP
jgi:hypothetical protein